MVDKNDNVNKLSSVNPRSPTVSLTFLQFELGKSKESFQKLFKDFVDINSVKLNIVNDIIHKDIENKIKLNDSIDIFIKKMKTQVKQDVELKKEFDSVKEQQKNIKKEESNLIKFIDSVNVAIISAKNFSMSAYSTLSGFGKKLKGFRENVVDALTPIMQKIGKFYKSFTSLVTAYKFSNKFYALWDNTVGKAFSFLSSRIPVLSLLFSGIEKTLSVLKWIGGVGIGIIGFMYDKMIMLAKFGWKAISSVFTVMGNITSKVVATFCDIFLEVISQPWVLFGAAAVMWLFGGSIIKTAKKFIGDILSSAWKWITDLYNSSIDDATKKQIVAQYNIIVANISGFLTKWFNAEKMKKMYDEYIGIPLGISSSRIETLFKTGIEFINSTWDSLVGLLTDIKDKELLDQLYISMNVFNYLSGGFDAANVIQSNIEKDTEKRVNSILSELMSKQASILAQKAMITKYASSYSSTLDINESVRGDIIDAGFNAVQNFKNSLKDSRLSSSIIDVNYDILLHGIINKSREQLQSVYSGLGASEETINRTLARFIGSVLDPQQRNKNSADVFSSAIDTFLQENTKDGEWVAKHITGITTTALKFGETATSIIDELDSNVHAFIKLNSEKMPEISKLIDDNNKVYMSTLSFLASNANLTKHQAMSAALSFIKQSGLTITPEKTAEFANAITGTQITQMELKVFSATDALRQPTIKKADGGVVVSETPVIVGEAGPELILPLNNDGISFLTSTMNEMSKETYNLDISSVGDKYNNIVKRIKKAARHTDTNMFDLKNLSTGFIGVV